MASASHLQRALALCLVLGGSASARDDPPPARDWVLVYYMSYDNDLEPCGPAVISGLEKGVKSNAVAVAVLADDRRRDGLTRHVITAAGRQVERLATDDSASGEVLADYLAWVARRLPAKHYAVVFLDHGGRLDEMGLDEQPGGEAAPRWLSAQETGERLRRFRRDAAGAVELLFLQQCGRASVENLYNFAGAARYVLASPLDVGKPNTYYERIGRALAARPESTGLDLARVIMAADEHFNLYACLDGSALGELPARLDACLRVLPTAGAAAATAGVPTCYRFEEERYADALQWLQRASGDEAAARAAVEAFATWLRAALVVGLRSNPDLAVPLDSLCGLSLRVSGPRQPDYPIYKDSHLDEFWEVMAGHE